LTGTNFKEIYDRNTIGGCDIIHTVDIVDGATANFDVVLKHKTRVTDAIVNKQAGAGGASDTITVNNGTNAITDAMSINVADKTMVRPATVDDATQDIPAGGTLRIVRTKASAANVACRVTVTGYRIP
jgi:hypothetical protein